MSLEVSAKIILMGGNMEVLVAAISPENKTMPEGMITTEGKDNKVITKIHGEMTLGTLINTIDDVINTGILASRVAQTK